MSTFGLIGLLLSFMAAALSLVSLLAGRVLECRGKGERAVEWSQTLSWAGHVATVVTCAALTVSVGVLVACFFTGDYSIQYVLDNHTQSGSFLFKLSGLWAGREGSLLFWAWIISLLNAFTSLRRMNRLESLDNMAVLVSQAVLIAFVGVMLFSRENMPFIVTDPMYYENGQLTVAAELIGMSSLLEHWAMAIHPPTLFLGYAGLTLPFAYAIAACIVGDGSALWVRRSERAVLGSWFFLTIGIGLGAVWAYVVLGWGGYWGWDPVENASLLAWLVCVALVHSFTLYRRRGMFKRWAVMCACLAFSFCIVGTFISRSGLVQSVHAFEGDMVSLVLFLVLIVASLALGALGVLVRGKAFASKGGDDFESMMSKDGMYFVNNVIMVVLALLLAYLTLASALPGWLPFGGKSIPAGVYNSMARPIGVAYLLMMAVCPLLSWGRTDPKAFLRRAKAPAVAAAAAFAVLAAFFALRLVPAYNATMAAGGSTAQALAELGPAPYYNGLALVGLAVAALLLMNSLMQLLRMGRGGVASFGTRIARMGGSLSHVAMAVILVGLIGSSMYVTEHSGYLPYDAKAGTSSETFQAGDYELSLTGTSIERHSNEKDTLYIAEFDVAKDGRTVGHVAPQVQLVASTQQQKLNAQVIGLPLEDVFVIYKGTSTDGDALSVEVRVNPLISFVWIGFVLLALGMALSLVGKRSVLTVEDRLGEKEGGND